MDMKGSPVRIRLNSTAVRVQHDGPAASARRWWYTCVAAGCTVWARAAVLACWHSVIPYLCPDLPRASASGTGVRREGAARLHERAHSPVDRVSASGRPRERVARSLAHLGAPGCAGKPRDLRSSRSPTEPIVLHLSKTPCKPGLEARAQHRAGRVELLSMSFETIERHIREQLARMVGDGGFDPVNDILAITVNRWPHGYAYQYNSLSIHSGLRAASHLVVAGSALGALRSPIPTRQHTPILMQAIDQAHRAVHEILDLR